MKANPNPQGKGLVPLLDAWQSLQPVAVAPKSAHRLLGDYLVSLLVLSAEFSFKPVPRKPYYLYWREGVWQLSLISPAEWGLRQQAECLGECQLGYDMTWRLIPQQEQTFSMGLQRAIEDFTALFGEQLASADALEDTLPFYVRQLPFYRRLLATGLAASLQHSIRASDQLGHSGRVWLQRASGDMPQLLAATTPAA
jgi:Protein of unknown function (DUF2452)